MNSITKLCLMTPLSLFFSLYIFMQCVTATCGVAFISSWHEGYQTLIRFHFYNAETHYSTSMRAILVELKDWGSFFWFLVSFNFLV